MASSCVLYHGPGAREFAIAEANRLGRLVVPPIGDGGLKVDDARAVTDLLLSVPVGEKLGVIVIGPMDEANPKSSDTLLKSIEEFPGDYIIPILWANDLGSVTLTIRSRCLDHWVPAVGTDDDDALVIAAFKILEAAIKKDHITLVDTCRAFDDRQVGLIGALSDALSTNLEQAEYRVIWDRLRVIAELRNPFLTEIIIALIGP